MPTVPYSQMPRQGRGEPADVRLVAIIEGTGADLFTAAKAADQGAEPGLAPGHVRAVIRRTPGCQRGLYPILQA